MADRVTLDAPRRSYIATQNFYDWFKSYSTSIVDLETVGSFSHAASDPSQTPKGRVLRENGRKLVPGANPGVGKYLVGVYDAETFLNGFIDPNCRVFALFNEEKPNFFDNDADSEHNSINDNNSEDDDIGFPVYTRGNIETTAGTIVAGDVTGTEYVAASATGQTYQTGLANMNYTGSVALTTNGGNPSYANITFANSLSYNNTPLVFLTPQAAIDFLWYESFTSTGFTIKGTAGSTATINWMVIGRDAAPQP